MDIYFKIHLIMPLQVGNTRTRVRITSKQCISMLHFLGLCSRGLVSSMVGMLVVYINQVRNF